MALTLGPMGRVKGVYFSLIMMSVAARAEGVVVVVMIRIPPVLSKQFIFPTLSVVAAKPLTASQ
jgi:hypothetical protein